mgnify:FL=1
MAKAKIGVIGGSGIYNVEGVKVVEEIKVETPFGDPSDLFTLTDFDGTPVVFLPRHGKGHRYTPTEVPYLANIWAMKFLGVERIITFSAVGSLTEEIPPCDFVIPSQIIDRTRSRENSFFGNGIVGHVSFADPFCHELNDALYNSVNKSGLVKVHKDKTYICMEGPLFSTKAESKLYKSWGADIIGMTSLPEAKLAREAGICYSTIAMSTDFDSWHEGHDSVTLDMVLKNAVTNSNNAQKMIKDLIKSIPSTAKCGCREAAKYAIVTDKKLIPAEVKKKLDILFGEYF